MFLFNLPLYLHTVELCSVSAPYQHPDSLNHFQYFNQFDGLILPHPLLLFVVLSGHPGGIRYSRAHCAVVQL